MPTANAGPDQTGICPQSAVMAAEDVTGLTGVWSVISGPTVAGIVDDASSSTTVSDMTATAGTYVFEWTISGGGCIGTSSDQVSISMSNCTNTLTQSTTSDQFVTGCNFTFTDDGGTGADYTEGVMSTQTTICPDSPDQYVTIDFTSIDLYGYTTDNIVVFDAMSDAAPIIGYADGTNETQLLSPATGDPITSSVTSPLGGCLVVVFTSFDHVAGDDAGTGWIATTGCTTTPGIPITDYISGTNCGGGGGITLCDQTYDINPDTQFQGGQMDLNVGASGGIATPGGNNGCLGSGESNEQWVYFQVEGDGDIQFSFDVAGGQDFDFAIWGPYQYASCPLNTGDSPIRCSWATTGNNGCTGSSLTGLAWTVPAGVYTAGSSTIGDYSEEGSGCIDDGDGFNDGFVEPITAQAGEIYTMLINNYANNNSNYTFTYTGSATLGCDPPTITALGVTALSLSGVALDRKNKLVWSTKTEVDNDYFIIEGSTSSNVWKELGIIDGSGNSSVQQNYEYIDELMILPITYYRLKQVDFDGKVTYSQTIALTRENQDQSIASPIFPNPSNSIFYFNYGGNKYNTVIEINVYNNLGQVVYSNVYNKFNKHIALSFDLSNFDNGLYQVVISQGSQYETQTISVLK